MDDPVLRLGAAEPPLPSVIAANEGHDSASREIEFLEQHVVFLHPPKLEYSGHMLDDEFLADAIKVCREALKVVEQSAGSLLLVVKPSGISQVVQREHIDVNMYPDPFCQQLRTLLECRTLQHVPCTVLDRSAGIPLYSDEAEYILWVDMHGRTNGKLGNAVAEAVFGSQFGGDGDCPGVLVVQREPWRHPLDYTEEDQLAEEEDQLAELRLAELEPQDSSAPEVVERRPKLNEKQLRARIGKLGLTLPNLKSTFPMLGQETLEAIQVQEATSAYS